VTVAMTNDNDFG